MGLSPVNQGEASLAPAALVLCAGRNCSCRSFPYNPPTFSELPYFNVQEALMAEAVNPGNQDFQTVLGPDATFKGELTYEKGMRLHGRIEGKVTTAGRLHIAKEAKMQADVDAGSVIVEGDVQGNLTANDRIEMKQTARYQGDLRQQAGGG